MLREKRKQTREITFAQPRGNVQGAGQIALASSLRSHPKWIHNMQMLNTTPFDRCLADRNAHMSSLVGQPREEGWFQSRFDWGGWTWVHPRHCYLWTGITLSQGYSFIFFLSLSLSDSLCSLLSFKLEHHRRHLYKPPTGVRSFVWNFWNAAARAETGNHLKVLPHVFFIQPADSH